MTNLNNHHTSPAHILSKEQETILDLYIQKLDNFFEELKASEKVQVEIETQHLKKIVTTK
ncbi:hypothetical protein [Pontibacter vulgaris]|uniref:hypothetical protein n=1 Tax=Pontibacter vulgaris TaxID=2905679 RepID=UPI001FA79966|nr:hypothetical protein [Pontibacter vulgaris]